MVATPQLPFLMGQMVGSLSKAEILCFVMQNPNQDIQSAAVLPGALQLCFHQRSAGICSNALLQSIAAMHCCSHRQKKPCVVLI